MAPDLRPKRGYDLLIYVVLLFFIPFLAVVDYLGAAFLLFLSIFFIDKLRKLKHFEVIIPSETDYKKLIIEKQFVRLAKWTRRFSLVLLGVISCYFVVFVLFFVIGFIYAPIMDISVSIYDLFQISFPFITFVLGLLCLFYFLFSLKNKFLFSLEGPVSIKTPTLSKGAYYLYLVLCAVFAGVLIVGSITKF